MSVVPQEHENSTRLRTEEPTCLRTAEVLGEGGFGVVTKEQDIHTGAVMAVKRLHSHLASDPKIVRRFHDAAEAAQHLSHPNIVKVLGHSEIDGQHVLAMEYVEGKSLRRLLDEALEGRLPVERALDIGRQVCDALDYAHGHGLIHRDIKPENILITDDGMVKITDFDIAKILTSSVLTQTATRMGTAYYMSPEQLKGADIDVRSDIYSLGVVLYEMLTGKLPVGVIEPPHKLNPAVPVKLSGTIMKALSSQPGRRFQTVSELKRALARPRRKLPTWQELPTWTKVVIIIAILTLIGAPCWVCSRLPSVLPPTPTRGAIAPASARRPDTPTVTPTATRKPTRTPTSTPMRMSLAEAAMNLVNVVDDFSDESVWPEHHGEDGEMYYKNGEYHILARETGGLVFHVERPEVYSDFTLKVDTRQVGGPDNNAYGLLFRYQDRDRFYMFLISGDGGYLIAKQLPQGGVILQEWTVSPYINKDASINHLKVMAQGPRMAMFINDEHIATVTDDSLAKGQIGLIVGALDEPNVHVSFDNLVVRPAAVNLALEADFGDEKSRVWPISSDGIETYVENGEYHALVEKTMLTYRLPRQEIYSDFILEADARQVGGPDKNLYGLSFRYQDAENSYFFAISGDGHYRVGKWLQGQWTPLADWVESPYINTGTSSNHLMVAAEGAEITVFINGRLVDSFTDASFAEGQVGLAAGTFEESDVHVSFDNFRVWTRP